MAEKVVKNDDANMDLQSEFVSLKAKLSALVIFFKGMSEFSYNNKWAPDGEEFLGITLIMEEMVERVNAMFDCYVKEV